MISVDASCTSMFHAPNANLAHTWNSICAWGPTAMLPVFQLFHEPYEKQMISLFEEETLSFDSFTKIDFCFPSAVATIKVGRGVKSEGELVISGTKGYIYVPAPWWKTDYFELRYEDPTMNKRYFYSLEGEGIRQQLLSFSKAITEGKTLSFINQNVSLNICSVMEDFHAFRGVKKLQSSFMIKGGI